MRGILKALTLFVLVLLLVVPLMAQEVPVVDVPVEVTESPPVVVDVAVPVVEVPVADDGVSDWLSPDVMNILVVGVLGLGLAAAFYVILRAMDALAVSVPKETMNVFGNQLIALINQTRQYMKLESEKTPTPLDDMAASIMDVPLDALLNEIKRRTGGDIPVEMQMAASAESISASQT